MTVFPSTSWHYCGACRSYVALPHTCPCLGSTTSDKSITITTWPAVQFEVTELRKTVDNLEDELHHHIETRRSLQMALVAALTELLDGEHASSSRDFGRGVAHAVRIISNTMLAAMGEQP